MRNFIVESRGVCTRLLDIIFMDSFEGWKLRDSDETMIIKSFIGK